MAIKNLRKLETNRNEIDIDLYHNLETKVNSLSWFK